MLLVESLERSSMVGLTLCDLSEECDCVCHSILLEKLFFFYGIWCTALKLIESYLHNGLEPVSYNNKLSNAIVLNTSVPQGPQGSILEPHLFIICTNDLHNNMRPRHTVCFADGTMLVYSVTSYQSLLDLSQKIELKLK